MRSALGLADSAAVLLERLAMTGQPVAFGARPIRLPLARRRLGRGRWAGRRTSGGRLPTTAAPDRPPGRNRDPVGIRDDRIADLDLDPEHGLQAGLLDRRLPPDDAVEALVVGHRESRQAELGGALGQLVGRRRTVQEREAGVAMELGIGGHRRLAIIEHLFGLVKVRARDRAPTRAGSPASPSPEIRLQIDETQHGRPASTGP